MGRCEDGVAQANETAVDAVAPVCDFIRNADFLADGYAA